MQELANSKYLVFHLVKHTAQFYAQTPEEEARSQEEINAFFHAWYPRVRQILGGHALGLSGEWDWIGVFAVDELSDWEALREDYKRRFPGRTEKFLSLPAVSHKEFTRATDSISHYKKLRALGVYPGGAEKIDQQKPEDGSTSKP
jgi:hypothetical protein